MEVIGSSIAGGSSWRRGIRESVEMTSAASVATAQVSTISRRRMQRRVVTFASVLICGCSVRALRAPTHSWLETARRFGAQLSLCGIVALSSDVAWCAKPQNAASSAGSRVNKDAESLLRYGLPLKKSVDKDARKLQIAVESIKDDLRTKRISSAVQDVQQAKRLIGAKSADAIASAASNKDEVLTRLDQMASQLQPLESVLQAIGPPGSPQERDALNEAMARQARSAELLSEIEARLVDPPPLKTVPAEFKSSPRLSGRARVKMVFKKGPAAESQQFDVDGTLYDKAVLEMIIDGYNAPLTAGNFLDLIKNKFYDGMPVQRADGFVVQTGDPDGPNGPLVGYGQKSPKDPPRTIPLELKFVGESDPVYGATSEDLGKGAAATSLPFQAYGALGMARDEFEPDSASSQFFFLLFDSDLTPAGKNLLDGRYANFGYTVKGDEFLKDIAEGDLIQSATIIHAPPPFGDYAGVDP